MRDNKNFKEKLIERCFQFSREIIFLVDRLPRKQSTRVIGDQLLRSATSIGANVIEAQAASSKKDFINFLNHALKSGNETKFWLALIKDQDKNLSLKIETLINEVNELVKILGSSIATLRGKKKI